MDKLERLLNLTAALLDTPRPLTADEIRDRIGGYPDAKASFRRAFERDKDDLRSMGVPIRVEPVPGTDPPIDGYRILGGEYAGRDLRLDPDELAALHLAANLVRLDGGAAAGLAKLGAGESTASDERPALGSVPFDEELGVLVAAAADRRTVTFGYHDARRTVEPWRLSFTRGHWYLSGWDRDRGADRVFRVDRLTGPVAEIGPAEGPRRDVDRPTLRGWEVGDGEAHTARLRVGADRAAWARHTLGEEGETEPDGAAVFTLTVRNPEAFRSFALSFLDHAEVLEPPALRTEIVDWLEALT